MAGARYKVLACGRRWGKTDACAVHIARDLQAQPPARVLLVAPTLDQARILFDRVVGLLLQLLDAGLSRLKPKVRASPYPSLEYGEHWVSARSGHIARSLRGREATHVVVDEAAFVSGELIHDVLWPMIATTDG